MRHDGFLIKQTQTILGGILKTIFFTVLLCATFINSASAQVRKCVGANGKVTYSDFICEANTTKEQEVKTNANTIDGSAMRASAKSDKERSVADAAVSRGAKQCDFKRSSVGNEQGNALADAAKEECLANLAAAALGKPTKLDAKTAWVEYSTARRARMQAAMNSSIAAHNAYAAAMASQNTTNAINAASDRANNKVYTCTPSGYNNTATCR